MTDAEEATGQVPVGLDVRLAGELIERGKAQGVSLVGPDGLLAGITTTVPRAALEAEMSEHPGYEKGERPERSRILRPSRQPATAHHDRPRSSRP